MEKGLERYLSQVVFPELGSEGQKKLKSSSVLIAGAGALGCTIAMTLARAGIGRLIIADRDFPELINLHRQFLYDEQDVQNRVPKAVAAAEKLKKANSEIEIIGEVVDINHKTLPKLAENVDLIMDGTDNLETRYLINDFCVKKNKPWVYGGVIGSTGMTMTIVPQKTACFRCIFPKGYKPGELPSCETQGVLSPAPLSIGAIESMEAIKILSSRGKLNSELVYLDFWNLTFNRLSVSRNKNCPCCVKGEFQYLNGKLASSTISLCGRNAVQILPPKQQKLDLAKLASELATVGKTSYKGYLLELELEKEQMIIFQDGRVIIKGTKSEARARSLYQRYLGGV